MLAQSEVTKEEQDVDSGVRSRLGQRGRLQLLWGNTLFHADDLPYAPDISDLPDVFTPFRNKACILQHSLFGFLPAPGCACNPSCREWICPRTG